MGYVSPKLMELVQTLTHLFTGKYLAYTRPGSVSRGKLASFFAGLVDRKMRCIFTRIFSRILINPKNLFRPVYIQSFMIIQPVNFESEGRQDRCDSCPDITVCNGKLVWSCRLEEMNIYGAFVQSVPNRK